MLPVQEKFCGAPAALNPDASLSKVVAGVTLLLKVMCNAGRLHSACAVCAGEGLRCPRRAEPGRFPKRGGGWCDAAGQESCVIPASYALLVLSVQEKVFGAPAALNRDAPVGEVVAGVALPCVMPAMLCLCLLCS